jgi:hypothetical protein
MKDAKGSEGSSQGKKIGHGARGVRAACGAGLAAAALLGMFASLSSAHALTLGAGGGITVTVPLLDAGVTLPILPATDAGSVSLPVLGSDAGIVVTLPLIPTSDAGTISLPLVGEDGGLVSLPGLGTDAGVALLCSSDSACGTGFYCNADLRLCLPALAVGVSLTDGAHVCVDAISHSNPACTSGECNATTNTCAATNGSLCVQALDCAVNLCNVEGHCGATSGTAVGTCTAATAFLCESSTCSESGYCVPSVGSCYADSDCSGADFCDRATFTCTPDLLPGVALPTDGVHSACTADASACHSGLCNPITDTCGAALGTVCSSGADCASNGCDPATHTCTAGAGSATKDGGSGSTGGGSGSGSVTVTGSGSVTAGSSADGGTAAGSTTGTAADAGTEADGEQAGDQNGAGCSMSPGSKTSTAVPFELLLGFVALGAMRRRAKPPAR